MWELTANIGTRLLEVGAHDDEQTIPAGRGLLQHLGVGDSLLGGVDRARADDYDKTIIEALEDARGIVASTCDDLARQCRQPRRSAESLCKNS